MQLKLYINISTTDHTQSHFTSQLSFLSHKNKLLTCVNQILYFSDMENITLL